MPRALLALAVGGGGAAGTALLLQDVPSPATPVSALSVPTPVLEPTVAAPSFDVVRIAPSGSAVIAGRAEPGAEVTVRDGSVELGQTRADSRGEWVLLPNAPLSIGGRELTLAARNGDGVETKGIDSVLLSVPAPAAKEAVAPLALLVPGTGAPRVLQGADAAQRPAPGTARLGLDAVDYDERGEVRFAGSAPPNSTVRVYVDNRPAGDAVADAKGRWTLSPGEAVASGRHRLRVDQLTAAGRVLSRVELPFQRSSLPVLEPASGRVIVQPGQNLWRLARSAYGTGVRYTVIYLANRDQIRDPKLIYPGQAFAVPAP